MARGKLAPSREYDATLLLDYKLNPPSVTARHLPGAFKCPDYLSKIISCSLYAGAAVVELCFRYSEEEGTAVLTRGAAERSEQT